MATQTVTQTVQSGSPSLLRTALRWDGILSVVSGLVLLVEAGPLAPLLGIGSPGILRGIGVVALVYAAWLFYTAAQQPISRRAALAIVIVNALMAVDCVILLLGGWLPLTTAGAWVLGAAALADATFAELQYLGLRRLR
jgi:hypothetical protein